MAFSWQEETYASGTTDISVDIEYLDKSYISVYLDGALTTDYSWSSDVLLTLGTALTADTVVLIVRRTDKEALYIVFGDGAAFIRENLDTQNTQFLHLAQELVEGRSIDGFYGDLSMNGFKITNLGAPTANTDAVNKVYVDELIEGEYDARVAADVGLQSQITGLAPVLSAERSVVSWHGQTIDNSVTIPDGVNAFSIGPQVTIQPGQEVTVGAGSYWSILGNVFESDALYNVTANNLTTEDGNTTVAVDEIVVDSDLGTMAAQNANSVSITGGSIIGINDLAVADGGTGASTASAARNNLGAAASGANTDITSITGSAATLTTSRTVQTNLASTSSASFNGSANITPGVTGTLPITNGGTGAITAAAARTNLGAAASAGVTDASSAAAGVVGEVLTASTVTPVAMTSGVAVDLISLVLTPGDWDLSGLFRLDVASGAVIQVAFGSHSTVSATLQTFPNATQLAGGANSANTQLPLPTIRVNITSNTTYYLPASASFSTGTVTGRGYLFARRVR